MLFTDPVFVFAFLPIYLILLYCSGESGSKNLISALAGLIFIAFGRSIYYALILPAVFLIWLLGILTRRFPRPAVIAGTLISAIFAIIATLSLSEPSSLESIMLTSGLMIFVIKTAGYLKYCCREEPERNFLRICAYFISPENFLIPPLCGYGEMKKSLSERKFTLYKSSAGLAMFIENLAIASVCGLSCDIVRQAATEYEAFPWANAVTLFIITVIEMYVTVSAYAGMSRGIGLLSGFCKAVPEPAFIPAKSLHKHADSLYHGFSDTCAEAFQGPGFEFRTFAGAFLIASTAMFAMGNGTAAFVLLMISAAAVSKKSGRGGVPGIIFATAVIIIGMLMLTCSSPDGVAKLFGALNISKYDYDVTYILNLELKNRLLWIILGAILVSPARRFAAEFIRRKASEDDKIFTALRIAETVCCMGLLVICAAAAL